MRRFGKWVPYLLFSGSFYLLTVLEGSLKNLAQMLPWPAVSTWISNSANVVLSLLAGLVLWVLLVSDKFVLHGVLQRLVRAVYSAIYRNQLDPEPGEERMYRVTCFRYCGSQWQRLCGTLSVICLALFGRGVKRRWNRAKQAIERGWEGAFLYCVERYGWENDNIVEDRTSLVLRVVPQEHGELFAGKVFVSGARFQSAETKIVNPIISKIAANIPAKDLPQAEPLEPIEESIKKLEAKVRGVIDAAEWQDLSYFMRETNTGLAHLFAINPRRTSGGPAGRHCNHFIGFKIYRDSRPWGVVSIDALDSRERFIQLIDRDAMRAVSVGGDPQVKRNPDDFKTLLGVLSNTFSSVISKGNQ